MVTLWCSILPSDEKADLIIYSCYQAILCQLMSWLHQAHFTKLSILNTHKTRLGGVCLVSAANTFVSLNDNRKINFEKFTVGDFH